MIIQRRSGRRRQKRRVRIAPSSAVRLMCPVPARFAQCPTARRPCFECRCRVGGPRPRGRNPSVAAWIWSRQQSGGDVRSLRPRCAGLTSVFAVKGLAAADGYGLAAYVFTLDQRQLEPVPDAAGVLRRVATGNPTSARSRTPPCATASRTAARWPDRSCCWRLAFRSLCFPSSPSHNAPGTDPS